MTGQDDQEKKYLIESVEHRRGHLRCWWCADELGYTENVDQAGQYTFDQAKRIVERAEPGNERAWLLEDVQDGFLDSMTVVLVNDQDESHVQIRHPKDRAS